MEKLLVICGPTSVGKTSLALNLAKKFDGEVVSADSRQVYKGMNIGTGKDLPPGIKLKVPWFKSFGHYEINGVKVWGYDLVDPKHDFSVAQYLKFAENIVGDITRRKKLPIIVGGTGLYIKAVIDGIPTAFVPKNESLRKNLSQKSQAQLYEMLAQLDSIKAGSMNASDRQNPRRLIRAIEVATWKLKHKGLAMKPEKKPQNVLLVGLSIPQEKLFERIDVRIKERMTAGIEEEIKKLIKGGVSWKDQAMTSLGYSEWKEYFAGKKTKKEAIIKWSEDERKYAKRQMVWFKKDKRIIWLDVTDRGFEKKLENLAKKWYIRP